MWELIAANKRRSVILLSVMAVLMIGIGAVIAGAVTPEAWPLGIAIASLLWLVMALTSYYGGDGIFLASVGAKEIQKHHHPTLFNIVEEMTIAAGLSKMPRIYIVDDRRPNAFAVGRDPEHASVCVTAGLLARLNRDEVQGVIAHELAHIHNRDILYVMIASVMVGVIALMSHVFLRATWYSGGRVGGSRRRSGGDGQAQMILMLAALLFAILGPITAHLLYFALSRRREYLADACGAMYTRYPEGLASALEKIAAGPGLAAHKNKVMAPMYIVNPGVALGAVGLFSTHPPTKERIGILRSMGGASLADYEAAFHQVAGKSVIPARSLQTARPVGVRPPWEDQGVVDAGAVKAPPTPMQKQKTRQRQAANLLWEVNGYAFIDCLCGAKLKVPPGFGAPRVTCPRCNRVHDVPAKSS